MSRNLLNEKIEHWQHRLLDLSKRNKMIHYNQPRRSAIGILTPQYEELYARIVENEDKLTFQRPLDRESDIRVYSFLTLLEQLSAPLVVATGDINTDISFDETNKTLKNLRAKSRSSMEEKGSNILYLSFGFLEWRTPDNDLVRSPLVMVPVTLTLPSLNAAFELKKYDDEVIINPTLDYYCKTKYGVQLPQFSENECTPDKYFKAIEELANQRGWKIYTEVSLGLLSFQKISMYNDLINNELRIKNNPIIRAMAEGIDESEEVFNLPEHLVNFDLNTLNAQESYQVMSADSSQQDAILYSKNNISFVIQGPPGTGKSQTIANIIAEALADEKKILFVAEKATALQVVLQRLSEVNLADFCLSLHNTDAKKRGILDELDANLKLKQPKVKQLAISQLDILSFLRNDLNSYVKELHQPIQPLGISCYEASGRLADLLIYPALPFNIENITEINQTQLYSYTKGLQDYSHTLDRLQGKISNNPWEGLSARITGYDFSETMKKSLAQIIL